MICVHRFGQRIYWSSRLSNESRTPSKVWKSMAKILRRDTSQSTPPPSVLTADGFLKFFSEKVESVRSTTGGHRPPEILFTAVTSLSNFRACMEDEGSGNHNAFAVEVMQSRSYSNNYS